VNRPRPSDWKVKSIWYATARSQALLYLKMKQGAEADRHVVI
jgi:hypothetical protein